eukprot:2661280-Pyramimonas_sp.AAC.1
MLRGGEHDGEFGGPRPRWIVAHPFLPPQSFLQMVELLRCRLDVMELRGADVPPHWLNVIWLGQ